MSQSNKSLSDRLLRYSAVASLTASGTLLAAPTPARAATIDVNCNIDVPGEFCLIDFDDDGMPEFVISFSDTYNSDLWINAIGNPYTDVGFGVIKSTSAVHGYLFPARLPYGAPVSAGQPGFAVISYSLLYATPGYGNWGAPTGSPIGTSGNDPTQNYYVGVAFQLDGTGMNFGWIELYIPYNGNVTVKRIGYNTTTGGNAPAAVTLNNANASNGLRGVIAVALAGLSGALLWLRRRFIHA